MERWIETHAGGVEPGKTTQLSLQMPVEAILKEIVCERGLSLVRVIAGRERIAAGEPLGQTIAKGVWVVCVVENPTQAPIIGCAKLLFEGEDLPEPAKMANAMAGIIPPKPSTVTAMRATKTAAKGAVIPGRNEVAVCMPYGDAKRLVDAIAGGSPIQNFEQPNYLRRFNASLAAFEGKEVEAEVEETPSASVKEVEDLRAALARAQAHVDQLSESLRVAIEEAKGSAAFKAGFRAALKNMSSYASTFIEQEASSFLQEKAS